MQENLPCVIETSKLVEKEVHPQEIIKRSQESFFKPEFTVPLYDATIPEGERFTFECHVIGNPIPSIIWNKESIPIANNPDYLTKYDNGICTLMIEETFAEDSARFSCQATNEFGTVETEAILKVRGKFIQN